MKRQLQFLIYRSAGEDISVDAVIRDESIWLTQKAMSELFEVQTPAVSVHAPGRKQQRIVEAHVFQPFCLCESETGCT